VEEAMMTTVSDRPAAASGTFALGGDLPVHRLGFGAMQLTGAVHGIQPDAILVDMSTVSPDTSRMLAEAVAGRFVIHGDHSGWFMMRLGRKDLGLAHALGSRAGLQLELTETVERLFDGAIDAGFADRDIAAVVESVRARRAPVPT
jgi:3-hydroxyisobutyrate dehydrogenase-like beta-hydroxyacid dehydrogenase